MECILRATREELSYRAFQWPSGRSDEAYTPRTQMSHQAREPAAVRAVQGALTVPLPTEIADKPAVVAGHQDIAAHTRSMPA